MTNDVTSLDEFIDSEAQRDFVRVLRFLLHTGSFSDHVLVCGDAVAGERLLSKLVSTYPQDVLMYSIEEKGTKMRRGPALGGGVMDIEPGTPVASSVRALLRQDPDAIALANIDKDSADMIVGAAFTGHLVFVSVDSPTVETALEAFSKLLTDKTSFENGFHFGIAVEVAQGGAGKAQIVRILYRGKEAALEEVATLAGGEVVVKSNFLPEVPAPKSPLYSPVLAAPVEERTSARIVAKDAYLPVVDTSSDSRSCLGGSSVLRPKGQSWPVCKSCQTPLALLVQLDLANLPLETVKGVGLAQLFVCQNKGSACDTYTESDPGVLVEVLKDMNALEAVSLPSSASEPVFEAGPISAWKKYNEDPSWEDRENQGGNDEENEATDTSPLHCDKLGGWPAWQQQNEWPQGEGGERMELLFQFFEGAVLTGGTSAGWDYDGAKLVPSIPGTPILDPNRPHHLSSIWSGDAVALLFIDAKGEKLSFRVQMT